MSLKNLLSLNLKSEQDLYCNSINVAEDSVFQSGNSALYEINAAVTVGPSVSYLLRNTDATLQSAPPSGVNPISWNVGQINVNSDGFYNIHVKLNYAIAAATTGGVRVQIGNTGSSSATSLAITSVAYDQYAGGFIDVNITSYFLASQSLEILIFNDTDVNMVSGASGIVYFTRLN